MAQRKLKAKVERTNKMQAIILSDQPKWVAKISNGEKKIEVRKHFPSDYVGWVYIYCTKRKPYLYRFSIDNRYSLYPYKSEKLAQQYDDFKCLNGKIVARFWCDKVEEIYHEWFSYRYDGYYTAQNEKYGNFNEEILLKSSCLDLKELSTYLGVPEEDKKVVGYAIHISQLEIFNKPKELSEFGLKRAPRSWQYMEVEE